MLIRLAVPPLDGLRQDIVFFLGIILCPGRLNDKMSFRDRAPKLNIEGWRMLSPKLRGFVRYYLK